MNDIKYGIVAGTIVLALVGGMVLGSVIERARLQKRMEEFAAEWKGQDYPAVEQNRAESVGVRWLEVEEWDRRVR
jgi:hypothetical protein